jgi:hypothetical protein
LKTSNLHQTLYLLTATLLITHEIDSAYQQEWNLFGLAGGLQAFLALNFVLVIVLLLGYRWLLTGALLGRLLSPLVALGGLFAVGAHAFFLMTGHSEFREPASLVLLGAILLTSLLQLRVSVGEVRGVRPPAAPRVTLPNVNDEPTLPISGA